MRHNKNLEMLGENKMCSRLRGRNANMKHVTFQEQNKRNIKFLRTLKKKKKTVQQRILAFFLQVFPISVQAFNFEVHRP